MTRYKTAMYYEKMDNNKVRCCICPQKCVIPDSRSGLCRARKNMHGKLYCMNYGEISSIALDPIEKKPLFHFYPGTKILSVGSCGCNMKCSFCQNWSISHDNPQTIKVTPELLVNEALEQKNNNCIGIAYTYNEPTIWYEFVYDTSKLAKAEGLVNVLVTNGFINQEPLENLLPYIDAMNIDVKAFTPDFYKKICNAKLRDVKKTVEICAKKCHVEITTLIIPGLNDSIEEIGELAYWLYLINPEIPLHVSRFFPNYKMCDVTPTPVQTLKNVRAEALKHLKHVYIGNV